ncbi:PP2C family protein-serine/threonine phosphatase [Kitasatospora viridis]|uniref:Serine phosphatase RsbU (Regulator of sigma subunit) n=1 Tax=Kitasatospora viridis TaxID=281105 RepID=A0A561UI09_9ACTN|nr:PP2C family protein-serine/threonine phosphatase [Kitasatospora viridis]TWF98974.1 serine phosphatase RsbU (regulator of sigma subunit) [Kitasatospora viridis]
MSDKRPSGARGTTPELGDGGGERGNGPTGGQVDGPSTAVGRLTRLLDLPHRAAGPGTPAPATPARPTAPAPAAEALQPLEPLAALDLLQRHTERLARARGLSATLRVLLDSGAELLGARHALLVTLARPASEECGQGALGGPVGADWPDRTGHGPMIGLALDHCAIGALETVPVEQGPFAGLLDPVGRLEQLLLPDLVDGPDLAPRFRAVAADLGLGASYALPLATEEDGPLAAAAWFFAEPGRPSLERRQLARRYAAFAAPLLAGRLAAERALRAAEALRRGLLPDHLPHLPGLRLAARWVPAGLDQSSGADWYDAITLPDGSVGLTVGSVAGDGPGAGPGSAPGAATAMGRLRAALRAYAVLEGEDPVAVLGDLELLLKTTEPARTATAVYACVDPAERRITLAGAGHCPPVLVTRYGANFVETSLSAPLGMLSCWEAPGVELSAERGDLLLLYTEGLARRCGPTLHAGQARLRKAAADAPRDLRHDPDRLCAHLLECCLPASGPVTDDLVLLAARFD